MHNNIVNLSKEMYNHLNGKTFTDALEELDPSSTYIHTPLETLDAFERQLKRYGIKVCGTDCDCVEKFFSSPDTAILFPEYVRRCIAKGFNSTVLSSITAVKTVCGSNQYTNFALELDGTNIEENGTATTLGKYNRLITMPYEIVKNQRLSVFGIMLKSIGVRLAASVTKKAMLVLETDAQTRAYELTDEALTMLHRGFNCFDMTTIIANPANIMNIIKMYGLSNEAVSADGKIILPFGSELISTPAIPENTVIGMDENFALEFITDSGLTMNVDKLMSLETRGREHQFDPIQVSITCGFRKIVPEAVKKLNLW